MMQDKTINFAKIEHSIRAVILNGSRVSPSSIKDEYQDYDIICIVEDVVPFVKNQNWINQFGKLVIMQKPDEIDGLWPDQNKKFTFLMLFEDGNRIDLTFMEKGYYFSNLIDSQSSVLLGRVLNLKPLIDQICRFVNSFCIMSQSPGKSLPLITPCYLTIY